MSRRPQLVLLLTAALSAAAPLAGAYEVVTRAGEVLEAPGVQFAGNHCILASDSGTRRLAAEEVDYYETFRRNASSGAGNVVVFRTGSFFRFEKLELDRSRVVLHLGDESQVTVPEGVIDFERSVQEAASLHLPRGARTDVARSTAASGSAARSASASAADSSSAAPPARGRSFDPRAGGGRDRARLDPSERTVRRNASLRGELSPQRGGFDESAVRDEFDENRGNQGDPEAGDGGSPPDNDRSRLRDGIGDADELRRQAEEQGEPTGAVSVIVSSNDAVDVAAVQFRIRYPESCSPVGQATIGAFANASMAQPNGAVGGRPIFAMAIVFAADATTSLPGEIARIDFLWRGQEPQPSEFAVMSATATDEAGQAVRAFRAEVAVLQ